MAVMLAAGLAGCSAIELNQRNAQATARTQADIAATVDSLAAAFQTEQAHLTASSDLPTVRATQAATASPEVTDEAMPTREAKPFIAAAADMVVYGMAPIDSDRLNSITALAFDSEGHLLVSLRAAEIYRMEDSDADGKVDAVHLIFEDQDGDIGQVAGLFVRGEALIVINGEQLSQLQDRDADGIYETVTQLSAELPADQSLLHASNGIIQAPDGRYFTANVSTGEILQIVLRE